MRRAAGRRWSAVFLAGVLLLSVLGSARVGATGQMPPVELMARVQKRYDDITRLHARFRQETRLQGFDQVQTGEGEVWILKPGMMRWDYSKPERQTIIANGETLWIYLPEERQVIRDQVQTSMGTRTPALFLAGQARLAELFSVASSASQVPGEEGLLRLELTPKEGTLPYSHVELGIHPTSYYVARVKLVDPLGSVTTMWFSDIDTQAAVHPSLFQFQVPSGVEVISPPVFPMPR
jgi:outer membrane lipoprotein carrier protein